MHDNNNKKKEHGTLSVYLYEKLNEKIDIRLDEYNKVRMPVVQLSKNRFLAMLIEEGLQVHENREGIPLTSLAS